MTTLGTMETYMRRSLLDDTVETYTYSQDRIWDALKWAIRRFAVHTALATDLEFTVTAGSETTYTLPSEVLGDVERNAVVAYHDTGRNQIEYLEPVHRVPGGTWITITPSSTTTPRGFYLEGQHTLRLRFKPTAGYTLNVHCWRYWPEPTVASDDIQTPLWADQAIMYLAAHHLLAADSIQTANIRQWGVSPDTGNPEHNPLMKGSLYMLKMANGILDLYPRQERLRHYIPGAR